MNSSRVSFIIVMLLMAFPTGFSEGRLRLKNCPAACQIHGVRSLLLEGDKEGEESEVDRSSGPRRFLNNERKYGEESGLYDQTEAKDLWLFTCRTLWDETMVAQKYLPIHEIGLNQSTVKKYGEHTLDSGQWSLCYGGGTPENSVGDALFQWKKSIQELRASHTTERGSSNSHIPILPSKIQLVPTNQTLKYSRLHGSVRGRKLTSSSSGRTGNKTILVVRIRDSRTGEMPSSSRSATKRFIFGPLGEGGPKRGQASVVEQYSLISQGLLNLMPGQFPGGKTTTPVIEVSFGGFDGTGIQLLAYDLIKAAEKELNLSATQHLGDVVDHTIFCLPDNVIAPLEGNSNWTAFTYAYSSFSMFRQDRCTRLSVVMHELGHALLGFQHSGTYVAMIGSDPTNVVAINGIQMSESPYGDESCYMGYSSNEFGRPAKAMNAHKHWLSGWYSDNAMQQVDPLAQSPFWLELVGHTQYSTLAWTPMDKLRKRRAVLLRMGNLFLQYNYVSNNTETNWNIDTGYPDTVTVVKADTSESLSFLVGVLEPGFTYVDPNYMNTGKAVAIHVCPSDTTTPSVVIMVHVSEVGLVSPKCSDRASFVNAPSPSPTSPSQPLFGPAPVPTLYPSAKPFVHIISPTNGTNYIIEGEGSSRGGSGNTTISMGGETSSEKSKFSIPLQVWIFTAMGLLIFVIVVVSIALYIYLKRLRRRKIADKYSTPEEEEDLMILPVKTAAIETSALPNSSSLDKAVPVVARTVKIPLWSKK